MLVLAPLEVIGVLFLAYIVFRVFRWAVNSRKVENAIEEVVHPESHNLDGVLADVERTKAKAAFTADETDAEIARKAAKNDRLRKAYGG